MCANVDKLPAMETSYLCDLVDAAKTESLELLKLLLLFEPLLKKHARNLEYPDAYCDLQAALVDVIARLDTARLANRSDGAVVNYIGKTMYHRYIALSKAQRRYDQFHTPLDELTEAYEARNAAVPEMHVGPLDLGDLHDYLTDNEYEIILLHFYYGYSISEIARMKKVSRQCVNQRKLSALGKLRRALSE